MPPSRAGQDCPEGERPIVAACAACVAADGTVTVRGRAAAGDHQHARMSHAADWAAERGRSVIARRPEDWSGDRLAAGGPVGTGIIPQAAKPPVSR